MSLWPLRARLAVAAGALLLALALGLGAAGAHALKPLLLANDPAGWFDTARRYHELHALGLVGVGLAMVFAPRSRWLAVSALLLFAGIALFCGSLYLRSLAGLHGLRSLTPLGGVAFIAAWVALALGAAFSSRRP
jgi:uncharacterized membrane protein YgdD (TMEM256/DUF423 family)